ncbi:MAG: hypothetical protein M0P31_11925 [Solirubrobacteraceae bacterium]|nr:hypothetical protein [Solirubrobacteraceae bacterium]
MPSVARTLLLVLLAALLVGGGALLGRAGEDDPEPRRATDAPTGTGRDGPVPTLAVGIDTADAVLLTPPGTAVEPAFDLGRTAVAGIAPRHVRVDVRWDLLQPTAEAPLDPNLPLSDGCAREGVGPCQGPVSLTRLLAAIAAARQARPGHYRPLITFWGVPDWAGAAPARGCRAGEAREGAQPLDPRHDGAYRAAVRRVADAVRAAGIDAADWTPWNEPNAPYFIDPQRDACDPAGDAASPGVYARLVRLMDAEITARPVGRGDRLALGELATWAAPSERAVPADEFLRALPDDVLCRADVLTVHGYLEARPRSGRGEPIAAALRELDRRPCLDGRPAWITETGVGAPRSGGRRLTRDAVLRAECRLMHQQLVRWWHDPRVTAAFQYSVREDAAFPVGLLDPTLARTYPVTAVWQAWGGDREPTAPPPPSPTGCATAASTKGERAPGG